MTNFRRAAALFLASGLLLTSAPLTYAQTAPTEAAVTVGNLTFAPTLETEGKALLLQGAGLRKILFIKVYGAGLYLESKAKSPAEVFAAQGPRTVRLGLLRDVSGSDFIEALEEGLEANLTPEGKTAIAKELELLKTLMRTIGDVKEGDLVDFAYSPAAGTRVLRNGTPVGEAIPGKALYDAVLAIWLGEKPIDDDLKDGMLGL